MLFLLPLRGAYMVVCPDERGRCPRLRSLSPAGGCIEPRQRRHIISRGREPTDARHTPLIRAAQFTRGYFANICIPAFYTDAERHLLPRCTLYVRYLYSTCTFIKRTSTVQILYKYCTTAEGVGCRTRPLYRKLLDKKMIKICMFLSDYIYLQSDQLVSKARYNRLNQTLAKKYTNQ